MVMSNQLQDVGQSPALFSIGYLDKFLIHYRACPMSVKGKDLFAKWSWINDWIINYNVY